MRRWNRVTRKVAPPMTTVQRRTEDRAGYPPPALTAVVLALFAIALAVSAVAMIGQTSAGALASYTPVEVTSSTSTPRSSWSPTGAAAAPSRIRVVPWNCPTESGGRAQRRSRRRRHRDGLPQRLGCDVRDSAPAAELSVGAVRGDRGGRVVLASGVGCCGCRGPLAGTSGKIAGQPLCAYTMTPKTTASNSRCTTARR